MWWSTDQLLPGAVGVALKQHHSPQQSCWNCQSPMGEFWSFVWGEEGKLFSPPLHSTCSPTPFLGSSKEPIWENVAGFESEWFWRPLQLLSKLLYVTILYMNIHELLYNKGSLLSPWLWWAFAKAVDLLSKLLEVRGLCWLSQGVSVQEES